MYRGDAHELRLRAHTAHDRTRDRIALEQRYATNVKCSIHNATGSMKICLTSTRPSVEANCDSHCTWKVLSAAPRRADAITKKAD